MKVYFAGMETIYSIYDIPIPSHINVFGSYYYLKALNKTLLTLNNKTHKGIITIDSGAHSFFGAAGISSASHHRGTKAELPDPETYFNKYLNWVIENYDKINYFVELDIQQLIGLSKIKAWRQRMRDVGVYDKCIPVHHSVDSWQDFEELVDTCASRYIGVEGLRQGKTTLPYKRMLKYCYDRNVAVHAFAFTKLGLLKEYPFTTVDSTTWIMSLKYGDIYLFKGNKIVQAKEPADFVKHVLDTDLYRTEKDRPNKVMKLLHNIQAFEDMESFLTQLWQKRGVNWEAQVKFNKG